MRFFAKAPILAIGGLIMAIILEPGLSDRARRRGADRRGAHHHQPCHGLPPVPQGAGGPGRGELRDARVPRRHPGGEGLRPGEARGAEIRGRQRRAHRRLHLRPARDGALRPGDRAHHEPRDRRGAVDRRDPRRGEHPAGRQDHRLHQLHDPDPLLPEHDLDDLHLVRPGAGVVGAGRRGSAEARQPSRSWPPRLAAPRIRGPGRHVGAVQWASPSPIPAPADALSWRTSILPASRARSPPSSAPPARARARSPRWCPGSTTRPGARSASGAWTCGRSTCASCASASRWCRRRRCSSRARSRRTCGGAGRMPPTRICRRPAAAPRPTPSSPGFPEGYGTMLGQGGRQPLRRTEAAPGHRARAGPPARGAHPR